VASGADERGTAKEATGGRRSSYWKDKPIARGIIQTMPGEVRAVGGESESKRFGSVENRHEVSMLTVAPAKESTLIQCDLGVLSQNSISKRKRRAETEVYPQHTRKSLRISGRCCLEGTEEGLIKPLEALSRSVKGKCYKEITDAQEAIMASIEEANATRGKTVSFSNIERLQPPAIWREVETGPSTSRFVRTVPLEETSMRSESRDNHLSHVGRTRRCVQQESSKSGPRSNSHSSSSSTSWQINKTEPTNLETAAEVVEVGAIEQSTESARVVMGMMSAHGRDRNTGGIGGDRHWCNGEIDGRNRACCGGRD
jgi:hypothetical protein